MAASNFVQSSDGFPPEPPLQGSDTWFEFGLYEVIKVFQRKQTGVESLKFKYRR